MPTLRKKENHAGSDKPPPKNLVTRIAEKLKSVNPPPKAAATKPPVS